MNKQQRHMASIVRAIAAGKWTEELPDWAKTALHPKEVMGLQILAIDGCCELRAVQTAEAFVMLALASDSSFDVLAFIAACGFRR